MSNGPSTSPEGLSHRPETHGGQLWQGLPAEMQEFILAQTRVALFSLPSKATLGNARLINKAFAVALRPDLLLFRTSYAGAEAALVAHVMRVVALMMDADCKISPSSYSHLYSLVYEACNSTKPPHLKGVVVYYKEVFYNAIKPSLLALVQEGKLQSFSQQQLQGYVRLMSHILRPIERYFLKDLELPEVNTVMRRALWLK